MNDQADNLRKAIRKLGRPSAEGAAPERARVITVTSGKGGVGKTSFTANLALALSEMRQRVLVVDADIGLANIEVLYGIMTKHTLFDVLRSEKPLRDIVCDGPEGVKFISGGSGVEEFTRSGEAQIARFIEELSEMDREYDFILIDTGAGMTETVLNMASAADDVVLVSTPDPTSVTDVYALAKAIALRDKAKSVLLVINRADSEAEAAEIMAKLVKVSFKFLDLKLQKLGYILNDPLIIRSVKQQKPFMLSFPYSQSSKKIREIATRLMERTSFALSEGNRGLSGFMNGVLRYVKIHHD